MLCYAMLWLWLIAITMTIAMAMAMAIFLKKQYSVGELMIALPMETKFSRGEDNCTPYEAKTIQSGNG